MRMSMSLRLKVMVGVLAPVSLTVGALAFIQYNTHRHHEMATAARTVTALGHAIESSLTEAMLVQDLTTIQKSIDNIAANPQVQDMFLLNTQFEVQAAPGSRGIGRKVSLAERGCLVIRRIERLTGLVRALTRGDLSRRADIQSGDELGELADAFNQMAEGLEEKARLEQQVHRRTAELERLYEKLQEKEAVRAQLLKQIITAQEADTYLPLLLRRLPQSRLVQQQRRWEAPALPMTYCPSSRPTALPATEYWGDGARATTRAS